MDLVALARNPVPSGAMTGIFKCPDGVRLRFARWEATRAPVRGTVCVFHGRGEFIEKYFEVIADLRRRGFGVATMDWRGQGGSARMLSNHRKGYVRSYAEYERDLVQFMREVVLPACAPPYYGLAHSMGGHILLRHACQPRSLFERIVLSAPMVAIDRDRLGAPPALARLYAETLGALGFGSMYVRGGSDRPLETVPFERNPLTSDPDRHLRNRAILDVAPGLGLGSPTVAWLRATLRSIKHVTQPDFPMRVQVPLLLFSAGADRIVSTAAIERLAQGLKVGAHVLIPGSRHEILQERDEIRQRFWAVFDAYLGVKELMAS